LAINAAPGGGMEPSIPEEAMSRPHPLPVMLVVALVSSATLAACSRPTPQRISDASATTATAADGLPSDIADSVRQLDGLLAAEWKRAGVEPTAEVDDATFIRRASLDLNGVIPTADQVRAFLRDHRPGKRGALVRQLAGDRAWARHLTNYYDELLIGEARNPLVDRVAFRSWLYRELDGGTAYDELVRRLVGASGVNSRGGRPDLSNWDLREPPAAEAGVNGAVNWLLRSAREPQNLAGATSRIFLGVQIQCAQCHDHPSDKWTKNDFERFTAAFMRTGARRLDRGRGMGIRRLDVQDVATPTRPMRKRMQRVGYDDREPRGLDGSSLEADSPRTALADWLTSSNNPWFARALVNRVWAELLGRGFVEPVDDIRADSEVVAPTVLAALTLDFVSHRYDLRRLFRVILATQAYQRSPAATIDAQTPARWQHFAIRPMGGDALLDSLVVATGIEPVLEDVVGERLTQVKLRMRRQFRFTFAVDEDGSDDGFSTAVPQALMLLNGPIVSAGTTALQDTTLGRSARTEAGDAAAIEQLYLAALSRPPAEHETAYWTKRLAAAPAATPRAARVNGRGPVARLMRRKRLGETQPRDGALEDLFWALLNSNEFYFVH
jgi:hypothetical protein